MRDGIAALPGCKLVLRQDHRKFCLVAAEVGESVPRFAKEWECCLGTGFAEELNDKMQPDVVDFAWRTAGYFWYLWRVRSAKTCWAWIEQGLVCDTACDGLGQRVVDFEDGVLGAVGAVFGEVLALDDGESVHDVGHGMAGRGEGAGEGFGLLLPFGFGAEVQVEEGGVQLAAQQETPILVPPERRAGPTAVLREGLKVPGGVGEFENAGEEPVQECFRLSSPKAITHAYLGREDWKLFEVEIIKMQSLHLISKYELNDSRIEESSQ